jgi:type IV secretion system protein VirD4
MTGDGASLAPGAGRIYLGAGSQGPVWAPAEQSVLVLGPPRSGKTSSLVVPNILASPGPVVSTSTKPDVLEATAASRGRRGECMLYDPSATVEPPPGVRRVRWSPVPVCIDWDDACKMARALVETTKTVGASTSAAESNHWRERAGALLAPLLHAAALAGEQLPSVLSWVDRHQPGAALRILDEAGATAAADLLGGITITEGKEQSGIWSSASGVLAGYRSNAARASTVDPDFDAGDFCRAASTLYVCATGQNQALVAPMVVGLVAEVGRAVYAQYAETLRDGTERLPPVVLALDEVANIAPLPDLPRMVSEGGGQGLLTLACLQDLSQARVRWGVAADGFLSLFGTTMVLPGIGDVQTLRTLSALAGDIDAPIRSVNAPLPETGWGATLPGRLLKAALLGRRGAGPPTRPTVTWSTRREPRLSVDAIGRGREETAVMIGRRNAVEWVGLTSWRTHEPWRTMVEGPPFERGPGFDRSLELDFGP